MNDNLIDMSFNAFACIYFNQISLELSCEKKRHALIIDVDRMCKSRTFFLLQYDHSTNIARLTAGKGSSHEYNVFSNKLDF